MKTQLQGSLLGLIETRAGPYKFICKNSFAIACLLHSKGHTRAGRKAAYEILHVLCIKPEDSLVFKAVLDVFDSHPADVLSLGKCVLPHSEIMALLDSDLKVK